MMPPICCLCDSNAEINDKCELVLFARRPKDNDWYRRIGAMGGTGHPPNVDWFCPAHFPAANELSHLTIDVAMAQLQSQSRN